MKRLLTVAHKEPGKQPRVVTIDDSLEAMRALVGGHIELVRVSVSRSGEMGLLVVGGAKQPGDAILLDLWCNEEGHRLNMPVNVRLSGGMPILGPCFLAGSSGEDLRTLTTTELVLAIRALSYSAPS